MANEAIIRDRFSNPIDFTVADGAGIEKGAVLELLDPRTASGAITADCKVAGIAAREKVASDGRTRLAVYRDGIFDMTASGAITVGDAVAASETPNHVKRASTSASGANILGVALETATNGEVFQVELKPGVNGSVA